MPNCPGFLNLEYVVWDCATTLIYVFPKCEKPTNFQVCAPLRSNAQAVDNHPSAQPSRTLLAACQRKLRGSAVESGTHVRGARASSQQGGSHVQRLPQKAARKACNSQPPNQHSLCTSALKKPFLDGDQEQLKKKPTIWGGGLPV